MSAVIGFVGLLALMIILVLWDQRHANRPWNLSSDAAGRPQEAFVGRPSVLERYTRWLAFSTVALMVFTAIYAVAFIYWVYIDERAFLTIEAKSVDVWEVGKPTEVSVVVQNVGKTRPTTSAYSP